MIMKTTIRLFVQYYFVFLTVFSFVGCTSVQLPVEEPQKPEKLVVSIISMSGGTTDPVGVVRILEGETQKIRILPERGYVIDSIAINGKNVEISDQILLRSIVSDHQVNVSFRPETVCLVLSVGGANGISHIGAMDALKYYVGQPIDSVFGNSMGSLIGGIYVTSPDENLTTRYLELMNQYVDETRKDITDSSTSGIILGGLAMLALSGGTLGWETLAGAIFGGVVGKANEPIIDKKRFTKTMDSYFRSIQIEHTQVQFATSYFVKDGNGLQLVVKEQGDLVTAISRSTNNLYIFGKKTDITFVDPGVDRIAAVPIEEAYLTFNPDRIIAINVTGDPAVYSHDVDCRVDEIVVQTLEGVDQTKALLGQDPEFKDLYNAGYNSVHSYYHRLGEIQLLK